MNDISIPDLNFPEVQYGSIETPQDLRTYLYRGGAATRKPKVAKAISGGALGLPIPARLSFVAALHSVLSGKLAAGGSQATLKTQVRCLDKFYAFADSVGKDPTHENAEAIFYAWIDSQQRLQRGGTLTASGISEIGGKVATIVAEAIGKPAVGMLRTAGINKSRKTKQALGPRSDRQRVTSVLQLGHALIDIVSSLTAEKIRGQLPVEIKLRDGRSALNWCGIFSSARTGDNITAGPNGTILDKRSRRIIEDTSNATRYPLINLRMTAEMLIFISQTGMNLAQATSLRTGRFSFQSHSGGYLVRRVYKGRARGEVEFEIFSEYRPELESYLRWRTEFFPDDPEGLLFPFIAPPGKTVQTVTRSKQIKPLLRSLGVPYFGPRELRATRANWFLRRSDDPELTAQLDQHSVQTLFRSYQRPHHQRAVAEATKFWNKTDPAVASPGPGVCEVQSPEALPGIPNNAPQPDCNGPSGCLFCIHNQDLDTLDHVWSLASYRHLKSLELTKYPPINSTVSAQSESRIPPVEVVIARLSTKLAEFEQSSEVRRSWVHEASARIAEEDYHPRWDGFIKLAEMI